jgi:hypothetical protein
MIEFCLEGVEDDKDGADDVELDDGVPRQNQKRWQVSHGSWKPVAPHSPCFEAPATAVASRTIWQTGERWQWVGLQGKVEVLAGESRVI